MSSLRGVGTPCALSSKGALPYLYTAGLRGAVQRYGIEIPFPADMLYVQLHTTT